MKSNIYIQLTFAFVLFLFSGQVMGQYASIQNRFEVDYIKGCAGWQVNVTINDPGGVFDNPRFWYTGFDSNQTPTTNLNHIFPDAGEFYIAMLVNNTDGEFENNQLDSILVEVIEPADPQFIIRNCDAHQVKVQITDDFYDRYQVNFTTTDFEIVDPLDTTSAYNYGIQGDYRIEVQGLFDNAAPNCTVINEGFTSIEEIIDPTLTSIETISNDPATGQLQMAHTLGEHTIYQLMESIEGSENFDSLQEVSGAETLINNQNTVRSFNCYQIETYDACNEVIIPSNILCSVNFHLETSEDGNLMVWDTDETQATSYNLIRNDGLLTEITDPTIKQFNDTSVICQEEYVYNVQALFSSGSSLAKDTAIIASRSGELPPITEYPSSTFNLDNEVVLNWNTPDAEQIPFRRYIVQKRTNNRSWRFVAIADDTTYIDTDPDFFGLQSYRITYDDQCGNEATPSPITQPILASQVGSRGKIVTYSWNKYETWINGIRNYTIERLDSAGNIIEEFPVLSGRNKDVEFGANDLDAKYIRVRAESLDETPLFTYSNVIESRLKTTMFLPNAFTPDDDGLNDYFIAEGPSVFNFRMEIYNRWGIRIFETSDLVNGWDGKLNGEEAPEGTYIYKIFFEDGIGKDYEQMGSFILLRQ
ncbi:gliding motility-associated C-terminal domain-containing protein [Reichenbachiella ulvae]|uniref:Gliding motility-associated C-terminal domain-containing protein n=1 Tax=Reichenbachiella ulvae TaxID=2980104 RepID=A0ABT3CQ68_9BACT|nr:gliding motility-associated C-terminal domain-containing protein [Reichenbachiella ulvae]MCV9385797.1 gliding motility-associated C-terminal domain-containing protein [Reichenbachiella ulvae]